MKAPRDVIGPAVMAIAKNLAMGVPCIRNARVRAGRTAATRPSLGGLQTYAYSLFDYVTRHVGPVQSKSILEIGPGDNILGGLAFLAGGAKSYTALDRFPGPYGNDVAREWYQLLAADWPSRYRDLPWPNDLDPSTFPDDPRVAIVQRGVEDIGELGRYDIICSYVVGEHVLSIDAFASATRKAIGDTGSALHVIDFSGHEWDAFGDPFLFLKFPSPIWKLMSSNRGLPNRVRFGEYVACFKRHGLNVEVVEKRIVDYDPSDAWVKQRADEDFLTHWAVFKLHAA